jgi:hypothetical protein
MRSVYREDCQNYAHDQRNDKDADLQQLALRLLCAHLWLLYFHLTFLLSIKKVKSRGSQYLPNLPTTTLGGSDRPLFLIFPLILLVQKRFCTDFVQQQAQLISLILRAALISLAFR